MAYGDEQCNFERAHSISCLSIFVSTNSAVFEKSAIFNVWASHGDNHNKM